MKAVDVEVEKAAIRKTVADYEAATNKGGAEGAKGYASFATADARWLPPEAPAIRGREAIAQFAAGFTEMRDFRAKFDLTDVVVSGSGDIASSVGTYKITGNDREGGSQIFEGKFVDVWHKQADGSWKVAVGIWNTNEPAVPSGPGVKTTE
jgi:uncharacterized protein (TIGR02246 family)